MTGVSWIHESGYSSGPICITNTHAVGVAHAGIVAWTVKHHLPIAEAWLLPVAGETWDGYLNDINGHHVTEATAIRALEAAESGPIELGSVGGGTGMNCYEFKGGSGSASRLVEYGGVTYTVGVFLQTNFGARPELRIAGIPFGELLAENNPMSEAFSAPPGAGSCIGIVLTDAPLLPDQCEALARRVTLGVARTGTAGSHFSGDLFLAESVGNPGAITPGFETLLDRGSAGHLDALHFIPWGFMDPFYAAVVQATEEAVIDSLVVNEEVIGFRGHRTPALPRDDVVRELQSRGVIV
jgi:L-aminopeptidase/D-esterase-like protein